jgi:hypothetical protein
MKNILKTILLLISLNLSATTRYIDDVAETGTGTFASPYNNTQWSTAMTATQPGDSLKIMPGEYYLTSYIEPVNSGTAGNEIVIGAYDNNNRPILHAPLSNNIIRSSNNSYYRWENIDMDGDYINGYNGLVDLRVGNDYFTFYNCKIYESHTDAVTIVQTNHTVFENCEIYYAVQHRPDGEGERDDAHGISFKSGNHLIVNNCNIHHCSGDCIQAGASLSFPAWDSMYITNSHLWFDYVNKVVNTLPANTCWCENGIDTKTPDSAAIADSPNPAWRAKLYIDNNLLHGFNGDFDWGTVVINMAVDATIKNTIVHDCSMAFSLVGPNVQAEIMEMSKGPIIKMINCVTYDTYYASLSPVTNVDSLRIWNCTFVNNLDTMKWPGHDITSPAYFHPRTSFTTNFDIKNSIFVGGDFNEAMKYIEGYETAVYEGSKYDFIDYDNHDYRLHRLSAAIDSGVPLDSTYADILGVTRIGDYDLGAYEYDATYPSPPYKATGHYPANNATGISIYDTLKWVTTDTSFIYFGTDATPDTSEYRTFTSDTFYVPTIHLDYNTLYYYRIDTWNDTLWTVGDVVSFTTRTQPTGDTVLIRSFLQNIRTGASSPWVNYATDNATFNNIVDSAGVASTIDMTIGDFTGSSNQTINKDNTCYFPDVVLNSYFSLAPETNIYIYYKEVTGEFYNFEFKGTSTATPLRQMDITHGGVTKTLVAASTNCMDAVIYTNIIPVNDSIGFLFNNANSFGYLNGIRIKEYFYDYEKFIINESPANGSTGRPLTQDITVSSLDSVFFYFGTDETPDTSEYKTKGVGLTYDPGTLEENTTYYWQAKVWNGTSWLEGDVWSFTTGGQVTGRYYRRNSINFTYRRDGINIIPRN